MDGFFQFHLVDLITTHVECGHILLNEQGQVLPAGIGEVGIGDGHHALLALDGDGEIQGVGFPIGKDLEDPGAVHAVDGHQGTARLLHLAQGGEEDESLLMLDVVDQVPEAGVRGRPDDVGVDDPISWAVGLRTPDHVHPNVLASEPGDIEQVEHTIRSRVLNLFCGADSDH